MHEFNAGCLLLQQCLKDTPGLEVSVHPGHWVKEESVFDDADAVMIFSDGAMATRFSPAREDLRKSKNWWTAEWG